MIVADLSNENLKLKIPSHSLDHPDVCVYSPQTSELFVQYFFLIQNEAYRNSDKDTSLFKDIKPAPIETTLELYRVEA